MLTILKAYGGYVALVAVLGLAFGLYRSEIRAAEARGEAREMAAQVEVGWQALLDSVDVWESRKAASDGIRDSLRAELAASRGRLGVAENAASQAVSDARLVIASLSDSLATLTQADLDAISAAIDSSEEATRLCTGALGTCETLVKAADSRIWDLEAEQRQSLDLNRSQALVIERLQNLRGPSVGWLGYLGWAAAVLEAVVIVVR